MEETNEIIIPVRGRNKSGRMWKSEKSKTDCPRIALIRVMTGVSPPVTIIALWHLLISCENERHQSLESPWHLIGEFRSMCQVKPLKAKWSKRLKERLEQKELSMHIAELKNAKEQEKQLKKERRKMKLERKRENERKNEIVQVIKNPAKIKRMSKKQLRKIVKRDTNPVPS
ncbi:hypothetical protein CEXT_626641 [Caerostris extrusa]|uniref:Coiled-coil domain-containing protein 86 n=1 Tax=Caerostris extrusa TaxID=172846 RepID=A0AAV4QC81_CAEEX|nr:hypothetical protein CEXT_626641 [Caerostris extrusa]